MQETREPMMTEEQVDKLIDVFVTALGGGDNSAELQAAVNALSATEWCVFRRTLRDLRDHPPYFLGDE